MNPENNPEKSESIILEERFQKLQQIAEVMKELGLKVHMRFIKPEFLKEGEPDFPIVSDGLDGVRISVDTNKGLQVWFTNGFEKQDNPKRLEIEQKLREVGLIE